MPQDSVRIMEGSVDGYSETRRIGKRLMDIWRKMIICQSPLRICLGGRWTDLSFYHGKMLEESE